MQSNANFFTQRMSLNIFIIIQDKGKKWAPVNSIRSKSYRSVFKFPGSKRIDSNHRPGSSNIDDNHHSVVLPNIIRFPDSSFNNKNKGPTPGIFRVTNGLTNGGHGKSRYRDATRSSVRQNSYKSLKKKYPTLTRLLQSTHDNLYSNHSHNANGI